VKESTASNIHASFVQAHNNVGICEFNTLIEYSAIARFCIAMDIPAVPLQENTHAGISCIVVCMYLWLTTNYNQLLPAMHMIGV